MRTFVAVVVAFLSVQFWNARYGIKHSVITKPDLPAGYYHAGNYLTQCSTLKDEKDAQLKNCEDATFWEWHDSAGKLTERKVLFSCDAGRREWNTVMGPLKNPEPHGSLWLYDPKTAKTTRISLENYPAGHDFHPLGIEIYPSYGGNASYLYAVNHARQKTVIEQFLVDPSQPTSARYLQTLTHPLFISPNSVALTSPTSFYVSNDHLITRRLPFIGHFVPLMETLLALPLSFVSHVALEGRSESGQSNIAHSVVAPFISFSNGVAVSPDRTHLAIASTAVGKVYIYTIAQSSSIKHLHTVQLPFSVDNLAWTSPSEIVVAGHPHFPSLIEIVANKEKHAPSWVVAIHIHPPGSSETERNGTETTFDTRAPLSLSTKVPHPPAPYTVETLFQSDGSAFSTSTTGLHDPLTGELYMSGLYAEEGAMVCKPEVDR